MFRLTINPAVELNINTKMTMFYDNKAQMNAARTTAATLLLVLQGDRLWEMGGIRQ